MIHPASSPPLRQQAGFVLIVALILLLILTIIGIAATQRTTLEEKMAGNAQNHSAAFQSAEAALRAAEGGINQGVWTNFPGDTAGLYLFVPTTPPQWLTPGFFASLGNVLNYNSFTGNTVSNVVSQPVFIIEQMPPVPAPGQSLGLQEFGSGVPQIQVFRITALGFGSDANSEVMLQSVYRP